MLQERILMGGTEGTGKTYAWLTIARALPDVKFYVIDPDDGCRRVWYSEFPDVENIEYYFTPSWFTKDFAYFNANGAAAYPIEDGSGRKNIFRSGVADAWRLIAPKVKQNDWVVVEHMHLLWSSVQDAFADEVFEKNIGSYFLEMRKLMKQGAKRLDALEGWTDWAVINKLHNDDFIIKVCFNNPGHVFLTTSVSVATSQKKEDADVKAFYGDSSYRFEGQKHVPFRVQTKLISRVTGRGNNRQYLLDTFHKDRGREWMQDNPWEDFYIDYLVMIGGWD